LTIRELEGFLLKILLFMLIVAVISAVVYYAR
jgi:hypothetical protein